MIAFPKEKIVVRPVEDLLLGERLAKMQGRPIGPTELFRLLNKAGLKGVLVGAHAINTKSGDPRATKDVDIIAERPKKVVELFHEAFPDLRIVDHPVVIRFKEADMVAIDVIKPTSSVLFKRILKLVQTLEVGNVVVTLADDEALLALKFQAMLSVARATEKRYQDAGDFITVAKGLKRVNEEKLTELGELAYPGGGNEILKLVADARAGRRLEF